MGKNSIFKNKFWFKLVVVIIVQALLLTQVDFTLAAPIQNKENYKEVALKVQIITVITLTQLSIGCLKLTYFDLNAVAQILKSFNCPVAEYYFVGGKVQNINKEIYKEFMLVDWELKVGNNLLGYLPDLGDKREQIARVKADKSTGPPRLEKMAEKHFPKPNC